MLYVFFPSDSGNLGNSTITYVCYDAVWSKCLQQKSHIHYLNRFLFIRFTIRDKNGFIELMRGISSVPYAKILRRITDYAVFECARPI